MNLEDVLQHVGSFGRYQLSFVIPIILWGIYAAFQTLSVIFEAGNSDHWCAEDEFNIDIDNCKSFLRTNNITSYTICLQSIKEFYIPQEISEKNETIFSNCEKYVVKDFNQSTSDGGFQTIPCDHGWAYDHSQYASTIAMEFNLVCDRKLYTQLLQSCYFGGYLVGSFVFGALADLIGRRKTFIVCVTIASISGMGAAFMPSFWPYLVMRSICGFASLGVYLSSFVLAAEWVDPSKRIVICMAMQIAFAIGFLLLTGLAMFIREWRTLQFVISLPSFLYFAMFKYLPESPRWLAAKGKWNEAAEALKKAAKFNGNELPEHIISDFLLSGKNPQEGTVRTPKLTDLFKNKKLLKYTLCLMYIWFVSSMVYYGLSLNTTSTGHNVYTSALLSAAVEIPAYLVCIPITNTILGRRLSTSLFFFISGAALLVNLFCTTLPWITAAVTIGKFFVAASFAILTIHTVEIFPTSIRTISLGLCNISTRLGGMLCPMVLLLNNRWPSLSLLLFGLSTIVAACLVLLLPETRDKSLPEHTNGQPTCQKVNHYPEQNLAFDESKA